jgi:hypothetical protein
MNNDFERLSLRKFKIKGMVPNATVLLLGRRRCLEKGTEILMYDGTTRKIEDIKVNDLVMGDDSTSRTVLETHSGLDKLYKITNKRGDIYKVNSNHILSLIYTAKKNMRDRKDKNSYQVIWFDKTQYKLTYKTFSYKNKNKETVYLQAKTFLDKLVDDRNVDIPIKDFLKLSKKYRENLLGYQVPIEFPTKQLPIDPYMIGYWLGDGHQDGLALTSQDSTVLQYFAKNLPKINCHLSYRVSSSYAYGINGIKVKGYKNNINYFLNTLHEYKLTSEKYIPLDYKCNSRENRLKLLAGFIDADGHLGKRHDFEITQCIKHEKLIDDIIYLARSLGFSATKHIKQTSWTHNGVKKYGEAFRININGKGIDEIPTLIPRKQAHPRKTRVDALVSQIKVEESGEGEYYGIELDGNHRYVLKNFIVTHNSGKSYLVRDIFYHHKEIPIGLIFSGTEEANPFFGDFIPDSFIHSEYDPDLIETMLIKQSQKVKKARNNGHAETDGLTPGNRAFVVLDDMLHDAAAWKKEKTIQSIFFNGRHYNLFFILTMQYPLGIPPALRSNIDYVFVFNEPSIKNRKKIYDDYAGMCPSFDHFCNILDSCTQNHECLVIKTSGNSSDLRDQIFWYKASKHDNFRVGHPKIWKYHDLHYNDKYDTQRDVEQEAVDKLKKKFAKTKKLKIIVNRQGEALEAIEESE